MRAAGACAKLVEKFILKLVRGEAACMLSFHLCAWRVLDQAPSEPAGGCDVFATLADPAPSLCKNVRVD